MSSTDFEIQNPASLATTSSSRKAKVKSSVSISYRVMIFYRFILAIFGGYLLATLSALVIAQYFADYRSSAATASVLIAFSLHCAAFIWVFMVNKTLKASLGILIPCLILWSIYKLLGS